MRFRDWDQFATRFPAEAELLGTRAEGNKFLTDMKARVEAGEDLTVNMRKALAKWAGNDDDATEIEMPQQGDTVTVRLPIYEAERVDGKYGLVNTYRFRKTAEGYTGRLETNCADFEDHALEAGITFDEKMTLKPEWTVEIIAKVAWVADRRPFLILGGRNVRVLTDTTPSKAEDATPEPPARVKATSAPAVPSQPHIEPPAAPAASTGSKLPDFHDWKSRLGL
jgi:hypothetical protein